MDSEDENLEMQLLQDQNFDEYTPLLHLLQNQHLATFKSLVRRALNKQPPSIDINHLIPHPTLKTFLDKAASDNIPEFVEFLLEVGADPNLLNQERSRAPIHFAAENGNADALRVLLGDKNINPNLEAAGLTALHYAVKANCEECTRLLLMAGASPNIPNSRGITALHFAADKKQRGIVQMILDNSRILDLDTYKDRKKDTARTVIRRNFPDITLPEPSQTQDNNILLRYYLTANDESNFVKTLQSVQDLDSITNQPELLRLAVEHNLRKAMDELLKAGALDPTNLFDLGKLAIEQSHPEILKELLSRNPKYASRLLLPASQELGIPTKPGPGNRNNRFECFKIILSQNNVDVRQQDDKGNTPLHYAARAENRKAVELLLKKGSYIGQLNNFGVPPLAHIAPGILEEHLDDCLTSSNDRTEEYEIIMDYQNLVPHDTHSGEEGFFDRRRSSSNRSPKCASETEALLYIAKKRNLKHLLKHPVFASFLYLKYLRVRHFLYFNFIIYLMYYVLLIWYIWVITSDAPEPGGNTVARNVTKRNSEDNGNGILENWTNHLILSSLILCFVIIMVIREMLQFISSPLHYITSLENWLEIVLIGLTFGLLLGAGREVGAVAILISTWGLVTLIAQHPRMSRDIEMFRTVTVNFTKFLFPYIFLILAFALCFYVLFKGDDNFGNPFSSIFKTIIMLTGEFDSGDLPFSNYAILSPLIFVGFIFLIVIILLNLLNGLAVNDTAEILSEAELVCLISRAQLVAYVERIAVGSPFVAQTNLCCCINNLPFQSFTSAPMRFLARRMLLFPNYLPHASLSVKPLKSYEISLHGRANKGNRCSTLKMDPVIAQRAKEVLEGKGRETNEDKILKEVNALKKRFDGIETTLENVKSADHISALEKRFDALEAILEEIKVALTNTTTAKETDEET